jgi:hypothetical protein
MTLRGLIIGIGVWLPATLFAAASWSQGPPPKRVAPSYDASYDNTWGASDYSQPIDYSQEIRKSLERLKPPERLVIDSILAELGKKSPGEIFSLKLETDDVCQEIDCRGASPTTVRHYVEAYAEQRAANDAHQTALRSAAAAERSVLIAAVSVSVSLLSLLISGLSYRRAGRSTKSAIPA